MPVLCVPEMDMEGSGAYSPTFKRKLMDTLNKSIGKQPMRYQVEVIPSVVGMCTGPLGRATAHGAILTTPCLHLGGLPAATAAISVLMERGSKICCTDPAPVDKISRTAKFRYAMKQV